MVNIGWTERKSPFLSASSLACLAHIPAVNITSGCAHACIYCYAKSYRSFPGENKVVIYKDIVDKIGRELSRRKTKPHAVYFSPSSDMFQPIPEVLDISHALLKSLFYKGIGVALVTKGEIPEQTLHLLLQNANMVKAQIGLITHDEQTRRLFEPYAASVDTRLRQMTLMSNGGIDVRARIVPIIPGITDTVKDINALLQSISTTGITCISISALFLRPAILASIRHHISVSQQLGKTLDLYREAKRISVHASNSTIIPLPRNIREGIYQRFRSIAEEYGMETSICGCMNPDIGGFCSIAGNWPESEKQLNWNM